jgi:GNAT superfamily N-acetyltransferase
MSPRLRFRHYQSSDLSACAAIGVEVFPLVTSRFAGSAACKMMIGHIDSCCAVSNYAELAVADGEVAGFIFARVRRSSSPLDMVRMVRRIISVSVCFLLGRYGDRGRLIRYLNPCLQQLRVLRRNTPATQAEVVLLAVAPEYQGGGVGRTLMDRFVGHALKHRVKAISVPTDESAGYRFYERYGFGRWAEFSDPLASYCAGRSITGVTYRLLLTQANR